MALHISPDKALGCALFAVAFRDVTLSFLLLTGWNFLFLRQIWYGGVVRVILFFSLSFLWKESQHDWNIGDLDFKP